MRSRKRYDRKRRKGAFVANQLNKLTRHFEGDAQIGGGNETLLSIGQMARLNAVSEKALRLYQAKGILEPAYTDEASGYRYYTLGQCATLDMICQLRCVGFSLEEIAETLKDSDVATLRDRVRDHVQQIKTQMHELAQAHQVGGDLLRSCEVYLDKSPCNQLMLESMPERRVLEFPLSRVETSEPEGDGAHAMGAWELNLRFVKREIVERELPLSLFRNVGCIIARNDLLAGCIRYDRAFVFVTPAFGEDVFREAKRIPAQTCLCEYIDGVFTNDGRARDSGTRPYAGGMREARHGAGGRLPWRDHRRQPGVSVRGARDALQDVPAGAPQEPTNLADARAARRHGQLARPARRRDRSGESLPRRQREESLRDVGDKSSPNERGLPRPQFGLPGNPLFSL